MPLATDNRSRLAALKAGEQLPSGSRGWLNAMLRYGDPDVGEQGTIRDLLGGKKASAVGDGGHGAGGRAESVRRGHQQEPADATQTGA